MGVYIDMEMPKDGETVTITICADGIVFEEFREPGDVFHAVPVPAHGDLIERDAVKSKLEAHRDALLRDAFPTLAGSMYYSIDIVNDAPTIIPAEPCNNLSKPCKEDEA